MPTRISFTVPEEDDHILLTTHEAVIEMDLMGYDIKKEHIPDEELPSAAAMQAAFGNGQEIVYVAECQIHGLHGERNECFVCGGPVKQVALARVEG
jgi:hypothetical protein